MEAEIARCREQLSAMMTRAGDVEQRVQQTRQELAEAAAKEAASANARPAAAARRALMSLPGVGEWTAAETAQRAFGDPDALSVGDYHLATVVGRSLLGHPIDDAQMVELLEPMRPHRHRAVRLLGASGLAVYARFGPRMPIPNLAEM